MNLNPLTGEVDGPETVPGTDVELVPLNLAAMDEDALLALFPTPVQAAGALVHARAVARRAPAALAKYRAELRTAERELRIALGLAVQDLRSKFPRAPLTELRDVAHGADERTQAAQEAVDTAWLLLEYARDFDRAIGRDIDILRSLNANLRGEHR